MLKRLTMPVLAVCLVAGLGAGTAQARPEGQWAQDSKTEVQKMKPVLRHQRQKAKKMLKHQRQKAKQMIKRQRSAQ